MTIIIFAGAETTGSALCGITRHLLQNRGVLHRATEEIRSAFATESEIKIASTGNLPYLNAVINEGLRIAPPSAIGVPRIVPKGGDTICGQWVPEGVRMSAFTSGMLLTVIADVRGVQPILGKPPGTQLPSSELVPA